MQGSMNNVVDISELYNIQRAFFRHQARKSAGSGKVKATLTGTGFMASIPGTALKGQFSVVKLEGNTRHNYVSSSNMNVDTNADGVVDNFNTANSIGAIFSFNDNAQKISITACTTNSSYARIMQGNLTDTVKIPCSPEEKVSARVECKFTKTAGSPSALLYLIWRNSAGNVISASNSTAISSSTNGYVEIKIENATAPALTAYCQLACYLNTSASASTTPESAEVWFKNAMLEKAATVGNYISSGTKSTLGGGGRDKSVGKNLWNEKIITGYRVSETDGTFVVSSSSARTDYIDIAALTAYKISYTSISALRYAVYDSNKNFIQGAAGSTSIPNTITNARYVIISSIIADISTINHLQVETGSTATAYEAHTHTEVYIPAWGGKSLPNGENDELIVSGTDAGKKTQRADTDYFDGSESWTSLVTSDNVYRIYISNWATDNGAVQITANSKYLTNADGVFTDLTTPIAGTGLTENTVSIGNGHIYLYLKKTLVDAQAGATALDKCKTYLSSKPATLIYQLAQPIVSKYYNLGDDLEGGPGHTVFFELMANGFKKPAFSTGKITVSTAEYPVTSIEKVVRFDELGDGSIQEVDVTSSAAISDNGTSITITNADYKKVYFYVCPYSPELSTAPSYTIEYDVADTNTLGAATHDYGAAAAAWTLTDAESLCGLLTVSNAGGAVDIIAPMHYNMYIVRNTSGQVVTIKVSGGTGVAIANTKTAMVIFNGTDYIRISSDV